MKPATPSARKLLRALTALCERGATPGEREAAAGKLVRLHQRYDFGAPVDVDERDIFADCVIHRDCEARHVHTFEPGDCDLAAAVQWLIEKGLGVEACLASGRDWRTSLRARVAVGSLNAVSRLAAHLAGAFREAWKRTLASGALRTQDRALFLRGLLDGATNDERRSGELLRNTSMPKRAPKATRRAVSSSGVAVHPYTLALDLGRRIRLSAPAEEIATAIDAQTRGQIAA